MRRTLVVLAAVALAPAASVAAQPCNEALLRAPAETARDNVIAAIDAEAIARGDTSWPAADRWRGA